MSADDIFNQLGFEQSVEHEFMEIAAFIGAPDGCNARLYALPKLKQARAAISPPGESGTNARGVFVLISRRRGGMQVSPVRRTGRADEENPKHYLVTIGFTDWKALKSDISECCLAARQPKKPRTERERGDHVALPSGFETNRSKH